MAEEKLRENKTFPKGADFEAAFPEIAKKKSAMLRNYAGEIQKDQISALRAVERELKSEPGFVGLAFATFGFSPKGGYSRKMKRTPDQTRVDVAVLHDSMFPEFNAAEFNELCRRTARRFADIEEGSAIHVMHTWVENSQYDLNMLRMMDSKPEIQWMSRTLMFLCFPTTGGRIGEYRKIASEKLAAMEDSLRNRLLRAALSCVMDFENGGVNTIINIHGKRRIFLDNEQKKDYLAEKRKYWKRRIEEQFGFRFDDADV